MFKMVNGTNFVWNYLDRNTDIKRDLARGIVNISSLSKYILRSHPKLKMCPTGVMTSIRRYIEDRGFEKKHLALQRIFENTKLEMSFGNIILHINKTPDSLEKLTGLFKKLNLFGEDNVNIVMDKSSFAIIFDNEHHALMKEHFNNGDVIKEIADTGQVVLKFDPAVMQTPNVFATILNEIGINDINVIDSITKREKFMIFVKEDDLMNTCSILHKFTKEAKKAG